VRLGGESTKLFAPTNLYKLNQLGTMQKLPYSQQKLLDWHRREVDAAQDELYKTRHNPSAHNRLFWARESCRKFVEELRAAGHAI
jgi:hypothetical protein